MACLEQRLLVTGTSSQCTNGAMNDIHNFNSRSNQFNMNPSFSNHHRPVYNQHTSMSHTDTRQSSLFEQSPPTTRTANAYTETRQSFLFEQCPTTTQNTNVTTSSNANNSNYQTMSFIIHPSSTSINTRSFTNQPTIPIQTCVAPVVQPFQRIDSSYLALRHGFPKMTRVHTQPPLYIVDNFLTNEECDWLIQEGGANLKRSVVVDTASGSAGAASRTSSSCFLAKSKTQWLYDKIELLTQCSSDHFEPSQVCKYIHGQFYRSHYDAFDLTTSAGRRCVSTGGQRIATILLYLNDVEEGGHTFFPKLHIRFKPVKGRALVFFPCTTDGALDMMALHSGEDAIDDKWVCQVWVRQHIYG